jgi:predicted nucleotidyltransferase
MRLNKEAEDVIQKAVVRRFKTVSRILLFGSRADDRQRGGDIDLFVETNETGETALCHKLEAISDIQKALGDQKIDLIVSKPGAQGLIAQVARKTGVVLWQA